MKAILMSIRPKYVAMILNGIKKKEVRSKFPNDYVGWVYIYCTKKEYLFKTNKGYVCSKKPISVAYNGEYQTAEMLNGKVVARFWCDKVEDYINGRKWTKGKFGVPMWGASNGYEHILKDACLTDDEIRNYVEDLSFSDIDITKLEIFDNPKELSEFENYNMVREVELNADYYRGFDTSKITVVKKAPQSWFYVEVKE